MHRLSTGRLVHVLALMVLVGAPARALAGGSLLCGTAGDDLVAARAGLVREWVVQLPFDSAGWRLEHVTVGEQLVVGCTGDGGVHAIQAASVSAATRPGSLLWSTRVGRPGGSGQAAGIGPALVTVAHDLDLHAFEAASGARRWTCQLGHASSAAAVPAGADVYCPMSDDGLMRLPATLAGLVPAADAGGQELDTGSPIEQPAVAYAPRSPDLVGAVWINNEGRVIAEVPTKRGGWEVWSFDTRIPGETEAVPAGPPAVRGEMVYVATRSGRLEAVRPSASTRGDFEPAWLQSVFLPGIPESGPVVAGDTVVVSLGDEGLVAYDARPHAAPRDDEPGGDADARPQPDPAASDARQGGDLLWRTPCGIGGRFVAVVGDRVWFVDRVNRLASVDLATGEPRECLPLGDFTLPVINPRGDRLVLASPDGLVVSLAPRRTAAALPAPAADSEPAAAAVEGRDAEPATPADEPAGT
ncbi:MAG: PQQ-binding-like beta-propeller repeat protein [Planctomycetaceae bacterium]